MTEDGKFSATIGKYNTIFRTKLADLEREITKRVRRVKAIRFTSWNNYSSPSIIEVSGIESVKDGSYGKRDKWRTSDGGLCDTRLYELGIDCEAIVKDFQDRIMAEDKRHSAAVAALHKEVEAFRCTLNNLDRKRFEALLKEQDVPEGE